MIKFNNSKAKILIGMLILVISLGSAPYSFAATSYKKYGDVNGDGKVNHNDVTYLKKNKAKLNKMSSTEMQRKVADVSGDGIVDDNDAELILMHYTKTIKKFPVSVVRYGDVNKDGTVDHNDAQYLLKNKTKLNKMSKTEWQRKAADVDGNGKVEKKDSELILKFYTGKIEVFPVDSYGDVNRDGKVDHNDAQYLLKNTKKLNNMAKTKIQRKVADVDGNGKVEKKDSELILKFYTGKIEVFPVDSYGDVNRDGKIDHNDATYLLKNMKNLNGKSKTNAQRKVADVSGDGKIDDYDAKLILMKYTEILKSFPVE